MLAITLGGRSVEEWKAAISPAAFQRWVAYFTLYPFDDYHRYHRPAALISVSLGGGELQDRLDWLHPQSDPQPQAAPGTGHTSADLDLFRAAGIKPPRTSSDIQKAG